MAIYGIFPVSLIAFNFCILLCIHYGAHCEKIVFVLLNGVKTNAIRWKSELGTCVYVQLQIHSCKPLLPLVYNIVSHVHMYMYAVCALTTRDICDLLVSIFKEQLHRKTTHLRSFYLLYGQGQPPDCILCMR